MPRYTPGRTDNQGRWIKITPAYRHVLHKEHIVSAICEFLVRMESQQDERDFLKFTNTDVMQDILEPLLKEHGFSYLRKLVSDYEQEKFTAKVMACAEKIFKKGFKDYHPDKKNYHVTDRILEGA